MPETHMLRNMLRRLDEALRTYEMLLASGHGQEIAHRRQEAEYLMEDVRWKLKEAACADKGKQ